MGTTSKGRASPLAETSCARAAACKLLHVALKTPPQCLLPPVLASCLLQQFLHGQLHRQRGCHGAPSLATSTEAMTHLLPLHLLKQVLRLLWPCAGKRTGHFSTGQLVHPVVSANNSTERGVPASCSCCCSGTEGPTRSLTWPRNMIDRSHNIASPPEETRSAQTAALALGPPQAP